MAPEIINKDVCARKAFEVACAAQAGLTSAGANISYKYDFTNFPNYLHCWN